MEEERMGLMGLGKEINMNKEEEKRGEIVHRFAVMRDM